MPRSGRGCLGALAGVLLAMAGCATAPERVPPTASALRPDEVAAFLRRWETEWSAFPGLRAAVDLTIRRKGRNDRTAAALMLSPTQLRVEVATPFGFPALVVTAGPDAITVFRPLERSAWTARPTPEAVARWLGAPLPPDVLIGLLVGRVPPPLDPATVRVETDGGPHLAFERDGVRERVWVTSEGRPTRLLLQNGERLTVAFEWTVAGYLQGLHMAVPSRSAEVTVRYVSAEYATPPPGAFELILPADVRIERVN